MNFQGTRCKLTLAIIVTALALPLAGSAQEHRSQVGMPTGEKFITAAAQINLAEIALGDVAQRKGNSQAVRDFGKRMIADHSQLETELQELAKKKGITLPSDAGPKAAALEDQLSADSSAQFDEAYVQHMLAGHKQAISSFEDEIEQGRNEAFKSYAESALPIVQDHIRIAEDIAGKMQLDGASGLESPGKAISASAVPRDS
jgi:putative membrane protein